MDPEIDAELKDIIENEVEDKKERIAIENILEWENKKIHLNRKRGRKDYITKEIDKTLEKEV